MKTDSSPVMVRLVQCQSEMDHFAGLEQALAREGLICHHMVVNHPPRPMGANTRFVVLSDTLAGTAALAIRQARAADATIALVMDGIVEYRNTFVNRRPTEIAPGVPAMPFLRPAPADLVVCCGPVDQEVLSALGNNAVGVGLPRLAKLTEEPMSVGPDGVIMVATANHAAFDDEERGRVVTALRELKSAAAVMGVRVVWRLTGTLDADVGVTTDARSLRECLADVSGVITTPSTVMVEAMLAGRRVGVLNPHPTPLWHPARAGWLGPYDAEDAPDWSAATGLSVECRERLERASERARLSTRWCSTARDLIDSVATSREGDDARQQACLERIEGAQRGTRSAVTKIAETFGRIARSEQPAPRTAFEMPARTRMARRIPASTGPVVVNCVVCDKSLVGGVYSWAKRLAAEFKRADLGYDVRTLVVCAQPDAWRGAGVAFEPDESTDLCVIDELEDAPSTIALVRDSIERLGGGGPGHIGGPAIIIPNYTDVTYAAAMQLRPHGARVVAVAHTDEPYYRSLLTTYPRWDAAVGVSARCGEWLKDLETTTRPKGWDARSVSVIPCLAPTHGTPRDVEPAGPIKFAYIGRMVETQKRISDLLLVVDELERTGCAYELHMVGDGYDLGAWRTRLAERRLVHGKVVVHGGQSPAWVQAFLRTIDASVLVSEFEGTSVSMLEAMGAGVVPVVTAVSSGVDEWVEHGVNGAVAPVGRPDLIARELAGLASDRARLARMGRAAWETARERSNMSQMAQAYKDVFDVTLHRPFDTSPSDLGLQLMEQWRWPKEWLEDPEASVRECELMLRQSGYQHVSVQRPDDKTDALIVRTDVGELTEDEVRELLAIRARGIGVVALPRLRTNCVDDLLRSQIDRTCDAVKPVIEGAVARGAKRIAFYGVGKHTMRLMELFNGTRPFVGFIDDAPTMPTLFSLPVVPMSRAAVDLKPDVVVLSSDAWEAALWERSAVLRAAGIEVLPVYGSYPAGSLDRQIEPRLPAPVVAA